MANSNSQSVVAWSVAQVWQFLRLISQMLLLGALGAIWRREFHWIAFGAGLLCMVLGCWGVGAWVIEQEPVILWGGLGVVATLSGYVIGRAGSRVGLWESYLAVLLTAIVFGVEFSLGWTRLLGLEAEEATYFDVLNSIPSGVRLLGSLWDRLLILGAGVGFLLAVFGGSLAFLFNSDSKKFDARMGVEWGICSRHLRGRKGGFSGTAVVAVLGICVGVGALVAVNGVMSGYQGDIQAKILSTNPHLVLQKYGIDFSEYQKAGKAGLAVEGVLAQTPFTFGEAMLSAGDRGIGVLLKGVEPISSGGVTGIEENLCVWDPERERCDKYGDTTLRLPDLLGEYDHSIPRLVVGVELFKRINQPLGTRLYLTTPVGIAGARGNAPKRMLFELAGIFQSGMHEFDSRLAYLHISASQRLMGMGDTVNGVEFRVAEPDNIERYSEKVLSAVGRYPYRTLDWSELNSGIFTALKLQKIVMFLVLTFIVIVAAFNIASTLFMTVVEKSHEIAVLKSMGARDSSIMKVFVLEGWVVGALGTLLGVGLGLGVCALLSHLEIAIAPDVYMVESLKIRIDPVEVLLVVLSTLIISHLATLFPALKAARQHPVDAMRYQ